MNGRYKIILNVFAICMLFHIIAGAQVDKPVPKTYTYKSVDGCNIQADVFVPNDMQNEAPVLMYIHGGALIYGSRKGIRDVHLNRYLDEGYVVVSIDYRLAPETKLPQIIEDLKDTFKWIRNDLANIMSINANRIGVVGHSAGGYLTLMSGVCIEPKPKVLISYYGYGDIVGDWYSKPDPFYSQQPKVSKEGSGINQISGQVSDRGFSTSPLDKFYLYCRQNGLWPLYVGGHDPNENPEFFKPYCPVQNVGSDYPPTLLLHGDKDTDVPYQQSVMMAEVLKEQGIEHNLITIKNGEHGFDRRHNHTDVHDAFEEVIEFLGNNLK